MNERNSHIDTVRGIACILLVAFHVIGDTHDAGLRVADGPLRAVNDALRYLRMPLFTFLSGIVYAYRPYQGQDTAGYVQGKLRRLLIPMLVVGTIFALVQANTPGSNASVQNWTMLHIIPVGHFWFLESIFLIFMLLVPLERAGALTTLVGASAAFSIASAVHMWQVPTPLFGVFGMTYLLPYFLLGVAVQRFALVPRLRSWMGMLLLGAALALVLHTLMANAGAVDIRSITGLAIGCLSCLGLLALRLKIQLLARIGVYSYTIYLFHVFFTAAARIVLQRLGLGETYLLFTLSLALGVAGPIVVDWLLSGSNWGRLLFLGKSKGRIDELWFDAYWRRRATALTSREHAPASNPVPLSQRSATTRVLHG